MIACLANAGPDPDAASPSEQPHWAYQRPVQAPLPDIRDDAWARNPIDRFVRARLEREDIEPSPVSDPYTLIRRLYLDMVGLPPSIEQVDAFVTDLHPDAYERVVDELLASPHYGERWAVPWLDAARHADSNGFQIDGHRNAWPYRDWVVRALNADMPFAQFTIEQIAGDLLPNATKDQKIASGFNRGAPVNIEMGVDQEENRINQLVDRVNVTTSVWLGATIECAQCHDHKYDPFSIDEYYGLLAYFNNTPIETALGSKKATSFLRFIGPRILASTRASEKARSHELQREAAGLKRQLLAGNAEPLAVARVRAELERVERERNARKNATSLVMRERPKPRTTRVLKRGDFLAPGRPVQPETPAALHPFPKEAESNRMGLARWLASPDSPLLGRVVVNRAWAEFFGHGIVATVGDFGSQGDRPTHPDLLDWLAVEFMSQGGSMKWLHRLIATSMTYRQSTRHRDDLREVDPGNELYARGPRNRLGAEFIRDNALAIGGLLNLRVGGPVVYPPQPPDVWRVTGIVDNTYTESVGSDRYRRGLYTVWRRSAPYPSFVSFDAPDRATSCLRRTTSNTPLQALTLLNDPVYVEAALSLALRILQQPNEGGSDERIRFGFRTALARPPSDVELAWLSTLYAEQFAAFRAEPAQARALVAGWKLPEEADAGRVAAWFVVSQVLLNLDEAITRG